MKIDWGGGGSDQQGLFIQILLGPSLVVFFPPKFGGLGKGWPGMRVLISLWPALPEIDGGGRLG